MVTKGILTLLIGLGLLSAGTFVAVSPASIGIDWFETPEKRLELRILSQLRATGRYDDPGKRFVIEAKRVESGVLRETTIRFRNNPDKYVQLQNAAMSVQPDELQVRLTASHATFYQTNSSHYFEDIEWTLDADGGWPFAAW